MKTMNKIMGLLSILAFSALFIETYTKASGFLNGATNEFIWNMVYTEISLKFKVLLPFFIVASIVGLACVIILGIKNLFFVFNSVVFSVVVSVLVMLFSSIDERVMMYVVCVCMVSLTIIGKIVDFLKESVKS